MFSGKWNQEKGNESKLVSLPADFQFHAPFSLKVKSKILSFPDKINEVVNVGEGMFNKWGRLVVYYNQGYKLSEVNVFSDFPFLVMQHVCIFYENESFPNNAKPEMRKSTKLVDA